MPFLGNSFSPPFKDILAGPNGFLASSWERFIRSSYERLLPLGVENSFSLKNNQSVAVDITDLKFSARAVSVAFIDFLIQRVTTGIGAVQLTAAGTIAAVYRPTSVAWEIHAIGTAGPSTSGITFSITAAGQVQYTSTNVGGTAQISKICWRDRTLAGKNNLYSSMAVK